MQLRPRTDLRRPARASNTFRSIVALITPSICPGGGGFNGHSDEHAPVSLVGSPTF